MSAIAEVAQRLIDIKTAEAEFELRQLRAARAARIDKLSVDRSHLRAVPLREWCERALKCEQKLADIRVSVSVAERMTAWRDLFRGRPHDWVRAKAVSR